MSEIYELVTDKNGDYVKITQTESKEWNVTEEKVNVSIAALKEKLAYWETIQKKFVNKV